ncbi:50S ribosomal protein L25 [Hyella patelloides LEGE 07179]|uniref:Large ribosomal subunit protein bL25 n=1 Tax=Hyella patelloides LEGE 07179 TaxID=945734 RepID=A0A563VRH1_9CYAN|nr:50S ribosomal protein L25/general stress protein Ctc [Hyella patelloides]VEP14060.1 50S ribosomal protein L25 [Hyella patelloides LEGE 07179]
MTITVECKTRPEGSKPKALRREGLIPAALYGHKGAESVSLTMPAKEAQMLLRKAAVNNTLVDLNISDISWSGKALIREVQAHPWKRTLYHLSFFCVPEGQTTNLVVPLEITGESVGIKEGGILEQNITELNISCTPKNIPQSIEINISSFGIGTNLSVGDLVLPEGVTVLDDSEQTVFSIVAPAKMATETSAEEEETIVQTEADA